MDQYGIAKRLVLYIGYVLALAERKRVSSLIREVSYGAHVRTTVQAKISEAKHFVQSVISMICVRSRVDGPWLYRVQEALTPVEIRTRKGICSIRMAWGTDLQLPVPLRNYGTRIKWTFG